MANFFDKLKKGMGIEIDREEGEEKPGSEEKREKRSQKGDKQKIELKIEEVGKEESEGADEWPELEGELAVDVYQTEEEIVLLAPIAGVSTEELNISLERDVLTIEGERKRPVEEVGEYLIQECYWGRFARKVIIPVEINPEKISAEFKNGILTIRMPKIAREKKRKILIKN